MTIPRIIDMLEAALGAVLGGLLMVALVEWLWRSGLAAGVAAALRRVADQLEVRPEQQAPGAARSSRPRQFTPPEWARQPDNDRDRRQELASPTQTRSRGVLPIASQAPLLSVTDGRTTRRVELNGGLGGWVVGSSDDAHVHLDPPVAAEHLFLQRAGDDVVIVDLTSEPRLTVNGRPVGATPTAFPVGAIAESQSVKVERLA